KHILLILVFIPARGVDEDEYKPVIEFPNINTTTGTMQPKIEERLPLAVRRLWNRKHEKNPLRRQLSSEEEVVTAEDNSRHCRETSRCNCRTLKLSTHRQRTTFLTFGPAN